MSRTHRRPCSVATGGTEDERFPAGRVSAFVAALVCLVLVFGAASWLGPLAGAQATAASASGTHLSVTAGQLGIVSVGSDVTFSMVVKSTDGAPVAAGRIQLHLDRAPLADRSALDAWLNPGTATTAPTGVVITTVAVRAGSGTQTTVTAMVPASSMKLAAGKVYPVEAVYSRNVDAQSGAVAATARTTVVADAPGTRGALAVVAPLTVPAPTGGVISAGDLERLTAADGELTARLTALQHRPVAIGLDPMIPVSIRLLGRAAPKTATAWLARLAAAPNEIFPLQYADADIAGQSQAGIGLLQPTSFDFAIDDSLFLKPTSEPTPAPSPAPSPSPEVGALPDLPTAESLTKWPYSLNGIGWPADGTVTAKDLDHFAKAGLETTILNSSAIKGDTTGHGVAARALINDHQVLVADSSLTAALRMAASASTEAVWTQAMTDLFAQLAVYAASPDPAPVLAEIGRDTSDFGWFDATMSALTGQNLVGAATLESLLRSTARTDGAIVNSPEKAGRIERIRALNDRAAQVDRLATAAKNPALLTGRYRADMLALLATSWLADPVAWEQNVDESLDASAGLLDDVRLAPMSDVQMFGGQVAIPITVINDLTLPVTVRVQTVPSNARLVVDDDVIAELAPGSQTKVLVPVTARVGNGDVTLSISLFNEDQSVQLDGPEYVAVTVRADWETFGTLILAVLVVGFFGLGIFRNIRRRRKSRKAGAVDPGQAAAPVGSNHAEEQHDQSS